jgi:multiple sugar transport system substrate-binding protein
VVRFGSGRRLGAVVLLAATAGACGGRRTGAKRLALIVAASERSAWVPIARRFEARHPGVRVDLVEGPNATDLRESLYSSVLLARDDSFDLVYLDVTWTAKFAAAGWLRDLDGDFSAADLRALLEPDVAAGRYEGRLYRVPVRTDAGLLYYRRDLLEEAGLPPPRTFEELARDARRLQHPPRLWGFVWPGAQYEGLVCAYLEVLRGFGGFWIDPATGAVGLDQAEARAALRFLVASRNGPGAISPPGVTADREEETRRIFQAGRAVFLRNWPYVWRLAQAPGSPVAGRIGAGPMVSAPGGAPASVLGGWGLAVSRFSRRPALAVAFIREAISPEGQRELCEQTGFAPVRREAYESPAYLSANPFLRTIRAASEHAVSRPAIARYAPASDILQRHLSAALTGLEEPGEALRAAARQTRLLLGTGGEGESDP